MRKVFLRLKAFDRWLAKSASSSFGILLEGLSLNPEEAQGSWMKGKKWDGFI